MGKFHTAFTENSAELAIFQPFFLAGGILTAWIAATLFAGGLEQFVYERVLTFEERITQACFYEFLR